MNINEILLSLRDDDLEYELLGAVLKNPKLIKEFYVSEECFFNNINKDIYMAMKATDTRGYEVDVKTVSEIAVDLELENRNEMSQSLRNMFDTAYTTSNIDYKLDKLQELYIKRQQVLLASDILKNVCDVKVDKLEKAIDNRLKKINDSKPVKEESHISYHFDRLIENMESPKQQLKASMTHMRDLDKIMKGMRRKELVIIGANPSTGKTVLATNIAEHHALKNNGINLIFSLEMSADSLSRRMMASLTNIQSDKITNAYDKFEIKDWQKTLEVSEIFGKTDTEVFENGNLNINDIRNISRKIKDKYKDSDKHMVIYIDYLGLIKKIDTKQQTREHMKDVAVGLKNLAKELNATVIALSQLSRDNEKDKRKPMMSDLKESGDIEAAADTVIMLYREDYQGRETEKKDIIELIVAKNRNGGVGTAEMKFIKELSKFINIG